MFNENDLERVYVVGQEINDRNVEKRRRLIPSMIRGDWDYHTMMQFPMKWTYGK